MALQGNQLAQNWDKLAWESAAVEVAPAAVAVVIAAAAVPAVSFSIALLRSINERVRLEESENLLFKFPSRVVAAEA
jgi:hypothetical protein